MPWPDDMYLGAPMLDLVPEPESPFQQWYSGVPAAPPQPELVPVQPGIGVPAAAIDQAAAALVPSSSAPPAAPQPQVAPDLPPPVEPPVPPPPGAPPWSGEATEHGVDAVSGGQLPPSSSVPWQTEGMASAEPTETPREMREYGEDEQRQQFNDWYDSLDAKGKFDYEADLNRRKREEQARIESIELDREFRQAEENNTLRAARMAAADKAMSELNAEATRLAETEPRSWSDDASPLKAIGAVIAIIAGGINAKNTGGRNLGLETIERLIDKHSAQQEEKLRRRQANVAARRGLVSEQYARADQDFIASEARRKAMWQLVERDITRQMQSFDPNGTTRVEYNNLWNQARAKQQEIDLRVAKAIGDQAEAEAKRRLEVAKHNQDVWKDSQDVANATRTSKANAVQSYASATKTQEETKQLKEEGIVRSPEYFEAANGKDMRPPHPMSTKQYKDWLATKKLGGEAREKSIEEQIGKLGAGDLVNEKNEPIMFRNPEAANRIAKMRAATDNVARLVDQVVIARQKYGWSSDLFKSPEFLAAQADMGSLIVEGKNVAELGALSGPDMELIQKTLGTKDPTEVRDPLPGLKQARVNAVNNLNSAINAEARPGQKPKRYEPQKIESAAAEERDLIDNQKQWDPRENKLLVSPDPEVRKRAASVIIKGADARARQESRYGIAEMGTYVQGWLHQGLITHEQAEEAMAPLYKQYRIKVEDAEDLSNEQIRQKWKADRKNLATEYEQSLFREAE